MHAPTLQSPDGTAKFLLPLEDGLAIESVLVPFTNRDAVCLSTQVGCAMNCSFCHTGQMGLLRNLSHLEIIEQYQTVKNWRQGLDPHRLNPNVVFMGQGEPLHNFEELKLAIQWLLDPKKGGLGPRQITVSTAGYLPGLDRFSELGGVNLALSLHSPFDEERSELIPLNRRWAIADIFKVIDQIPLRTRQFINCEYLVIGGLNHSARHAEALGELLGRRPALINLIPFNPVPNLTYSRPSSDEIEDFKKLLVREKLRVFLRTTKGDEIMAACGQLNTEGKQ